MVNKIFVFPSSRNPSTDRATQAYAKYSSPALVIWGEKDNFVPRSHGESYAKLLPNCSDLKIIPAAGHSVIVEKPEETAKLIIDFLSQAGPV